ncbi:hypothetical protein DFH06DRAFT_1013336 [Mycena polygramma]|nr:hypothetical protein DFH06DRAFT_1013336 [Mycena polygramma]
MATPNTAIIDDRDPLVHYAGAWIAAGASSEFNATTMFSEQAGSTASLAFVGTSVTVYGTVAARNLSPQASWSFVVDGSISGTYTPPNNMTADIHHQPLSGDLTPGTHTLVVTAENDQPAWADYFLVTPNPAGFVPPSSSSASASASFSASPSVTLAPSHKSTPVGAIVGPIVGVLALIALAAFIFVCRRRRRNRDAESQARASLSYIFLCRLFVNQYFSCSCHVGWP